MNRIVSALLAATVISAAIPVAAEVVRFEVTSKTPYGSFRPGEYELWRGKIYGELAPTEAIPDIDKARRNARGKVEYVSEIMLLMPADPAKGNGTLIVDVPNRGRVYGIALYNGPHREPFNSGNIQHGTGFLQDRGYALAEVQWELGTGVTLPSFDGTDGKPRYVEGAGFAIMRDVSDFLARRARDSTGTANPLAGSVDRVLGTGKSQSGRFLKTYLLNGFNQVDGRRVMDGMHVFVSGSGLLPILTSSAGPKSSGDGSPSFADPGFRGVNESPLTIGEIVAAVEKRGELPPRIVMVSSTTDFLSLRASLGRTGAEGTRDQAIPANVRMYDIAGASHVVRTHAPDCKLPLARLDWAPVSRATLVALDRWVGANATPPDNRLMPLEATTDADVLAAPGHLARAVMQRPRRDADGNAMGGVRLPDMEAPLGVHAAQQEPKSFGCSLSGAYLAFSPDRIAALYKGRDDYVQKVRTAARTLQAERLLLAEDAAVIIDAAASIPWPPVDGAAEKK